MKNFKFQISNFKYPIFFGFLYLFIGLFVYSFISSKADASLGNTRTINFQGRVVNKSDGTNIADNTYSFTFKLYDAASSGNLLWQETQSSVQVTSGIFQVQLGSSTAFNAGGYNVNFNTNPLYLDITFNGETFGTRAQLATVPYALNAETLDGVIATSSATGFTLTGGQSTAKSLTVNNTLTLAGGSDGLTFTVPTPGSGTTTTALTSNASSQTITSIQTTGTILGISDSTAETATVVGQSITLSGSGAFDQTGLQFNLSNATGTNLNDIVGTGSTWKISKAGVLTVASCSGCGSVAGGLIQVPTTTGTDTVTPTAAGVVAFTINGTSNSSTTADTLDVNTIPATGLTATNGVLIQQNGAGTTTNGLQIQRTSGTLTNGLVFTGTITNDITTGTSGRALTIGTNGAGNISLDTGATAATINLGTTNASTINVGNNAINTGITINAGNNGVDLASTGVGDITLTANGGGQAGIMINDTGMGPVFTASSSGTTLMTLANTGSVTINNTTSTDIVKTTSGNNTTPTDFTYTANSTSSTLTNLDNNNNSLILTNGTVPNSGNGNITTGGATVDTGSVGAGGLTITRSDGKYLLIHGGGTATSVYDSYANTFSSSTAMTAAVGAGSLALPRPDGKYEVLLGNGSATRNTVDPLMNAAPASEAGANFCASATSGTVAYRRLNGKFLVACGGLGTTALFDPVAISWAAGPSASSGTWGAGALVLPRPDGQALIVQGGATATTQLYDPYNGAAAIGSFTAGPALPTGCEINGAGSVAIQLPNYTYLILSKANVSTIYDPQAGTFGSCTAAGPSTALADGAHAIPMQNGKYLIIVGSGSTKAVVYDPTAGTFTDHGTALSTIGAGSHSFMRPDGTWQIVAGGGTATNVFSTGLPMTGQYISEDITNTNLNITSSVWFDTGAENILTGQIGQPSNGQFGVQVKVRTASSQGNLSSATDKYIQNSGGLIYPTSGDAWIRITVNFTRRIPNYIMDDRATWTGNGSTVLLRDYQSPILKELTVDNSTLLRNTSFDFTNPQPSSPNAPGPTLTRLQGMVDKLVLPPGVLTETSQVGTTGFYTGKPGPHNPLPASTGDGTIVLQRPDKMFGIIATGSANFTLSDPTTATFSAQTGAGNIPTANTGGGAFSLKLPGNKYLVVMGNNTTTTNIYDPNAASGSHFTAGPTLSAAAGMGATAILNADNTYTIIHGGGATTTSIFDPVGNQGAGTLPAGPTLTTAANCGFFAIPMAYPNSYQYFVAPGVAQGVTGSRVGINYDAKAKVFTQNSATFFTGAQAPGCGAYAFQRQDGYWLIINGMGLTNGGTSGATNLYNPWANTIATGPTFSASTVGRGSLVIPRADGTFLITFGQNASGTGSTTTNIYFPWGNTFGVGAGIGTMVAGPTMNDSIGAGAIAFWRPDGKFVVIAGGQTGSTTVDTYDAGWYADGQYLSGQNNVTQLSANSTLSWNQTSDKYVGVQIRTSSTQAGLATTSFHTVPYSGANINIAAGDVWVQVEINMSRDFPVYASIPAGSDSYTVAEGGAYLYPTIAMPTLTGYKISNDSDILTLQTGGSNVFRVSSNGSVYTGSNGGYYSGGADLAERYTSSQDLQPGEVVTNDPATDHSVMRSAGQYQNTLLGVVSTDPGFIAGAYTTDSYPIALSGRVPVKISTENGAIHAGDYLTSASIPGYAMKATVAGPVIGKAMQDFDPTNETPCPQEALGNLLTTQCGSIMMFVNLTDYQGESIDVAMADATQNATGVTADGMQQLMAVGVPQYDGNVLLYLEHVAAQTTGKYNSQIFTGRLAATDSVIAPTIVADTLYAKVIKADQIDGMQIFTNKIAALSDQVASLSSSLQDPYATQSAVLGIATPSGQLTLASLSVNGLATISANFHVQGNSLIEGILTVADTIMANNLITNGMSDFFGQVLFHNDVFFQGHTTFSADTAGFATIHKGDTTVTVIFAKPYDVTPIVNVSIAISPTGVVTAQNDPRQTILSQGYAYIVTNQSNNGFTIQLSKPATTDVPFSWSALMVSSPTTSLTNTGIASSSGQ